MNILLVSLHCDPIISATFSDGDDPVVVGVQAVYFVAVLVGANVDVDVLPAIVNGHRKSTDRVPF